MFGALLLLILEVIAVSGDRESLLYGWTAAAAAAMNPSASLLSFKRSLSDEQLSSCTALCDGF